jgi:hypothetical protein
MVAAACFGITLPSSASVSGAHTVYLRVVWISEQTAAFPPLYTTLGDWCLRVCG